MFDVYFSAILIRISNIRHYYYYCAIRFVGLGQSPVWVGVRVLKW